MSLPERKPSKCVPCDAIYLDKVTVCDWCGRDTQPIVLPSPNELEPIRQERPLG